MGSGDKRIRLSYVTSTAEDKQERKVRYGTAKNPVLKRQFFTSCGDLPTLTLTEIAQAKRLIAYRGIRFSEREKD